MRGSARFSGLTRLRRLVLAVVLMVPVLAVVQPSAAQDDIVVRMVTDTAGLGDQNFNDLAFRGGTQAAEDFGVDFDAIESRTAADYIPNLTAGAEQGDLTIGVGFLLTDAITEVAAQFPDDQFMLIDSVAEGDNIASVLFKEQEAAFLTGVIAGMFTETDMIGVVGGQQIPPVVRYAVGFEAGVMSVNPDAEVIVSYTDTFDDPALGKELSLAQFNQGVDILLPVAGRSGIGSFDAAKEKGEGFWIVAGDTDQSQLGAEFQLAVAFKGVDTAVYTVTEQVVNDEFEGGIQNLGLAESGVDLGNVNEAVPADIVELAGRYKAAIIAGDVVVPTTEEELATFEPVEPDAVADFDSLPPRQDATPTT